MSNISVCKYNGLQAKGYNTFDLITTTSLANFKFGISTDSIEIASSYKINKTQHGATYTTNQAPH